MKELEKSQYDSYGEETKGKESIKQDKSAKEEEEDKSVENVYSSKSKSIFNFLIYFCEVFSNHWEKQYNVPDSLRMIFGSSGESKLSRIIG